MTKARDLANLASTATALATDSELTAAISAEVTARNSAIESADSTPTTLLLMGA